jgi:putative membrane protein
MARVSPPLTWTFSPTIIVLITVSCVIYVSAWRRARRPSMPHPPGYGRMALFLGSQLCLVLALLSPIDSIADNVMFVHMIQHILLLDIVPILLILSLTKGLLRPVTRRVTTIERRAGLLAHPAFAAFLYIAMMALWHVPHMYDLALEHVRVHYLEHTCFLVAGTLYWWHLLSPIRARMALGGMGPVVYMSVTKFFVGMLGIVLTFSTHAFYPWYEHHHEYWGLTARTDQNLAGVVMALEQSVIMGVALVYIVYRMLGDSEQAALRQERHDAAWESYRRQLAEHRARSSKT